MIMVRWVGKAVSENRRLRPGRGRLRAQREYEAFIDGLAFQIRAVTAGRRLRAIDLTIRTRIWKMRDKQNLVKPICDAIERSGLIENDRDIRDIHVPAAETHARGEPDQIELEIVEVP